MSLVGTSEMSAGGPLRRSHSKSALFNEDVLERKTCFRTPYQSGVQGGLSYGVQALLISQQSRPVTIYDRLQLYNFVVNVTHTHGRIPQDPHSEQARIGWTGLYFNGRQCQDDEQVILEQFATMQLVLLSPTLSACYQLLALLFVVLELVCQGGKLQEPKIDMRVC